MTDQPIQQPSAEDEHKAQQVAVAGATAAAGGQDPAEAMKEKRDEVRLQMSDEDIERIAAKFNELNVAEFEKRGAFEPPPEPVSVPAQAPPPPGEPEQHAAEPQPQAPQKRTLAHKFFGQ